MPDTTVDLVKVRFSAIEAHVQAVVTTLFLGRHLWIETRMDDVARRRFQDQRQVRQPLLQIRRETVAERVDRALQSAGRLDGLALQVAQQLVLVIAKDHEEGGERREE